ncbi:MAG: MFS transporter [Ruminococcaceae bacterium]|nr:MFS transporter [Oscillospiraceae bacterium]
MKKIGYKWVIVALCFLMVLTTLGFGSSVRTLFLSPITEALGIERSKFSLNDSCRFISTAIINIFFGTLVCKFGAKKLIGAGFLSLISAMLIYAFANNIWFFCVGGVMLGIGLSWTTTTMVGYVVNKWCRENKGTIMGFVLAANGIGGAVATQIVSPIIYRENDIFGYRKAYLLIAVILFAVGTLVMIFFRNDPKISAVSEEKKEKTQSKSKIPEWDGVEYKEVRKTRFFYLACVSIFLTGLVLQGMYGISAAHMKDIGIDAEYIALVMSVHSISLAFFKFLAGFLYDKAGLRVSVNICITCAIVVSIILASLTDNMTGRIFAMLYGILCSAALPLETVMLPIYARELFGEKSFNKVLGIFVSVNTTGYALGSPMMNLCFDKLGSYRTGLYSCSALMIFVFAMLWIVITEAKKFRANQNTYDIDIKP